MAGIYIHIPFCKQACNYCDFHFSTNFENKSNLVDAIVMELNARHDYLQTKKIESIYFGGGTPSLLNFQELDSILEALKKHFHWEKECEITLEANPDDINIDVLKKWIDLGINRLSIGIQSFNDEELKWMNRAHTAEESLKCVALAQSMGFENISIDLIYGSKFQNIKNWEATLEKAISLNTQHISAYNLTIEGKTKLNNQLIKGKEPAVDDYLSSLQFQMLIDKFLQYGFEQYEISNFAKPGFIALHNTNYWFQKHYLGLGPSAHSYNGHSRQWNIKNNALYVKRLLNKAAHFEMELLNKNDLYNEFILTRLRTKWGCDLNEIEHLFGEEIGKHFLQKVMLQLNLFNKTNHVFILNAKGRLLADGIAAELFL